MSSSQGKKGVLVFVTLLLRYITNKIKSAVGEWLASGDFRRLSGDLPFYKECELPGNLKSILSLGIVSTAQQASQ